MKVRDSNKVSGAEGTTFRWFSAIDVLLAKSAITNPKELHDSFSDSFQEDDQEDEIVDLDGYDDDDIATSPPSPKLDGSSPPSPKKRRLSPRKLHPDTPQVVACWKSGQILAADSPRPRNTLRIYNLAPAQNSGVPHFNPLLK